MEEDVRAAKQIPLPIPYLHGQCEQLNANLMPLKFPMTAPNRALRFSKDELLCLLGVASFLLSLFVPFANAGQGSTIGLRWFVVSLLAVFLPLGEAKILSALAILLHLACLLTVVAVFFHWKSFAVLVFSAWVGIFCAMLLSIQPFSGFKEVYFGFPLWIASAVWILLAPIVARAINRNRVAKG